MTPAGQEAAGGPSAVREVRSGEAPGSGGTMLRDEFGALWRNRRMLAAFVATDIKHRYVGSSIGFFWTVVNPILELVTYTFVFNVLMGVRFHPSGGTVHYSLFLFCGMVAWFALDEGVGRATVSITGSAHLIKKVNFPASILPAHVVLSAVVNQCIRTVILALGVILLGDGLSAHFLLVPAVIGLQCCFTMGLSFFLATANVYFRDTAHWMKALMMAWMFVTPIFYPAAAYPRRFALLLQLNPLAHIVGIYQELILNQRMPDPRQVLIAGVFAALALVVGFSVFIHHRRSFADLV